MIPLRPAQREFAEFFAGIGLMRMGLERAGWSAAFANDICADKFAMYRGHFRDAESHFALADIHALPAVRVPDVALATASFPCTDLSLAGMRSGLAGSQSSAFWGFVRVLREMGGRRPPLLLIENVTGFLSSQGGEDFRCALVALNTLGYAVDALVLNADRFVPQSRARLFIIASLDAGGGALIEDDRYRPAALAEFIATHPRIRWNIRHFPALPQCMERLEDILESLPAKNEAWWSAGRVAHLLGQMNARHAEILRRMRASEKKVYATAFRRIRAGESRAELRTDGIAGCLRTPKGGSARQILIEAGRGGVRARLLTARECARLMGAGDYVMDTSLNKALFGFGDAVCVPAVAWLAEHYLNPLMDAIEARRKAA